MKRMLEVPLESGGSVLMEVEVDESEQEGMVPAARPGEMATKAKQTFEEALEQIKPGADAIVEKLRGMSANAGAFIAASGIEANFTVLLKWNRS